MDIPSISKETLNEIWDTSKQRWKALDTITSRYVKVIRNKSPISDTEGNKLCNAIRQISDLFYPSQLQDYIPAGIVHSERLDGDHANVLVKKYIRSIKGERMQLKYFCVD